MYDMPNMTSFTPVSYIDYVVGVEPLLFPLILLAVFVVTMGAGLLATGGRFEKAFIFSCFINMILSVLFSVGGWLSTMYVGLSIVILAFSILMNHLLGSRD